MDKVRIDKWLWAARFFKTRNLAKEAIASGKVKSEGQRLKPSKELTLGTLLSIRAGWDEREVEVVALSEQRRSASEAQLLYRETEASIRQREASAEQRRLMRDLEELPATKPSKKQRRQIHRFKRENS